MFHVKHFYDYKTTLPTCFSKFVKLIQLTFTKDTCTLKKDCFLLIFSRGNIRPKQQKSI